MRHPLACKGLRRVRRWRALRAAGVLAGALAAACMRQEILPLPAGAEQFQPFAPYAFWWDMVSECSQMNGDLAGVTWYYVPDTDSLPLRGRWVDGYWSKANNRVVLSSRARMVGQVVRHEMLHALTRGEGHDREFFVERCGGVVSCTGTCREEAGTPTDPPAGAPLMSVHHLRLESRLYPDVPLFGRDSGFFAVSVSVTNDSAYDAWIALDSVFSSPNAVVTFGSIQLVAAGPDAPCHFAFDNQSTFIWNDQHFGIPAHSTRRLVFDRHGIRSDGDACIYGFFNADTAAVLHFNASP